MNIWLIAVGVWSVLFLGAWAFVHGAAILRRQEDEARLADPEATPLADVAGR